MQITLPWPPSVNRYWRHPNKGPLAGRHLISVEGRIYRSQIIALAINLKIQRYTGRLAVHIEAFPPDKRARDLDNLLKSTLDAMVHASIIEGDEFIDDLHIVRAAVSKPGHLIVTINQVE
jgi:crossover junction endodeoxyribonuclease RusA